MSTVTELPLIVDGVVVCEWTRELFEDMKAGGLTAGNFTCCIWEGMEQTLKNIADWKHRIATHSDLLMQVYHVRDIERARKEGRIGVILGWQNSTGFGDYLPNVKVFAELGVRIVQMTYNTANSSASGCYESRDGGLTDFGRELLWEMNTSGIAVDLSHVGTLSAQEVIATSKRPVTFSHICPAALHPHARNKSDEQLRYIADRGGFVGVCAIPPFMARGYDADIGDYVEAILHVRNVVGKDSVGIATDLTQGHTQEFFDYIGHDKGYGREVANMHGLPLLKGFENARQYPNVINGLANKGLSSDDIEKIAGRNWMRYLNEVWR